MVHPCETPASSADENIKIRGHDNESQQFRNSKNNLLNTTRTGQLVGNTEKASQETSNSAILMPLIDNLGSVTISVPENSTDDSTEVNDFGGKNTTAQNTLAENNNNNNNNNNNINTNDPLPTDCAQMNSKNINYSNTPSTLNNNEKEIYSPQPDHTSTSEVKSPVRRVRANHRRNLSLDFRAMGIVLPPLPELAWSRPNPARRLQNIPESPAPCSDPAPIISSTPCRVPSHDSTPAITPKIKHVVRRILSRRIN